MKRLYPWQRGYWRVDPRRNRDAAEQAHLNRVYPFFVIAFMIVGSAIALPVVLFGMYIRSFFSP